MKLYPVFLSGGVGSRLWPVSRQLYPKQFLPLVHHQTSMLQQTIARVGGLDVAAPLIVCNEEHRFLVAEQLRQLEIEGATILLEPEGRNTAPAVAAAAAWVQQQDPDGLMLVLPADHVIADDEEFCAAVTRGLALASENYLVTFGVVPVSPETGYGYIRRGDALGDVGFSIGEFVEKPDAVTAKSYVEDGSYYWNSGMFLLGAGAYLAELENHAEPIFQAATAALQSATSDLDFIRLDKTAFCASPDDSIDYAVMEHTLKGVVVPLDAGWSDVGAWSSLWEVQDGDSDGNVVRGDVETYQVGNSYLHSESRLLAAVGVDNLVVVETADAVLVSSRDHVQDVKKIVDRLKAQGRPEIESHTRVYRPWGSYESLVESDRFQVKRIIVNQAHSLSLQMHHHRAEHWIVVKGTALVECDGKEFMLSEDQSTYIPLGHKHRLTNPGAIPLEIIEVQTGSYLGEDDIVRFEDVYGRMAAAGSSEL
ncbi:MAG: mannose-1-phosphate guanylyltransferase/mannose-6-phosphate isomerase [Pseudomonadales bacterium]